MMKKQCTKCKRMLDHLKFSKDKSRKDGLQYQCKECQSKYHKERNADLKREAIIAFGSQCVQMENGIQCPKNIIDNPEEMHLSHPNGDGDEHRDLISNGKTGRPFYDALKKLGYNPGKFVVKVMCKPHHKSFDNTGRKHLNYRKRGKLSSLYKEGKFNDPAWLEKEYETKSLRKIAKECGESLSLIYSRMIRFNIPRRKSGRRKNK